VKTMSENEYALRKTAIHLLRSGKSALEVAKELERSPFWVHKWRKRFFKNQNWQALRDRSRTPKSQPRKLQSTVLQAIRQTRSELEAEAAEPGKLSYIDAQAVWARLRKKGITPLPSVSSIERELRVSGFTRPYRAQEVQEVNYPHIHPTQALQLIQIDIVPHFYRVGPVSLASMPSTLFPAIQPDNNPLAKAQWMRPISCCVFGKRWASLNTPRWITKLALAEALHIRVC
jgi:transposase